MGTNDYSHLKVLVVDDNAVNLRVASGLLKALFGVIADEATSGREALEMVKERHYDLVFMDHMMPEMDGAETATAIRAMGGQFEDIAIIALTANAAHGIKELMLNAGMNDFLSKPLRKEDLVTVLDRWGKSA